MAVTTNQRHSDLGILITVMLFIFISGLAMLPWFPEWTLLYIIGSMSLLGLAAAKFHFGDDEEIEES